jgi:hypothetical protein
MLSAANLPVTIRCRRRRCNRVSTIPAGAIPAEETAPM